MQAQTKKPGAGPGSEVTANRLCRRFEEQPTQWNCSSSVEPVSAVTLDLPPWMTVVTSSK